MKWWEVMGAEKPEAIHLRNDLWSQFIMDRNATQHRTFPALSPSSALAKVRSGHSVPLASCVYRTSTQLDVKHGEILGANIKNNSSVRKSRYTPVLRLCFAIL